LDEHASRTTTRVEDPALVRFEHLDEDAHNRARRVELAGIASLGRCELPEEVLVDAAEDVVGPVIDLGEADLADQVDKFAK
jgi:hypothetical protein